MDRILQAASRIRSGVRRVVWFAALTAACCSCWADQVYSAAAVKAAYLYRFAGYIEWPKGDSSPGEFTIVVVRAHEIASQLKALSQGRQINGRPIRVEELSQSQDIPGAQMAYIGPDPRLDVRPLIRSLESRHIVVVTDEPEGLDEGGLINFVMVDQRVRFEVSLTTAKRGGFGISSELLSVAARVQGHNHAVILQPDLFHAEYGLMLLAAVY